jgi:predicted metal-dependent hydrolase
MQLELPLNDAAALRDELERRTGLRIAMTVTDNTHNLLSVKPDGAPERVKVRLHHMFLAAEPGVVKALSEWIRRPRAKRSGEALDAFIRANRHLIRQKQPRRRTIRVRTRGRHFDLKRLYDEVNEAHFGGEIKAHITWGQMPKRRGRRRSIRFGSYSHELGLIRIHPLLDQEFVPEYFVRYIVYHEMLHAHLGVSESETGRRMVHTAEFRKMEEAYPDYDKALTWQNKSGHLRKLLG